MDIGEKQKTISVPIPVPRKPFMVPEREPVPVRRSEPVREPLRRSAQARPITSAPSSSFRRSLSHAGMTLTEIPYECPECGRPLLTDDENSVLYCPEHGVVQCSY